MISTGSWNNKLEPNKSKHKDKIKLNNNEKEKISTNKEFIENDNNNQLKDLVNHTYFKYKINQENQYDLSDFEITDVLGDGNYG